MTGVGLVTGCGNSTAATWDAVVHGRSGVTPIAAFDASASDAASVEAPAAAAERAAACADVLWALLNSKEFIYNH